MISNPEIIRADSSQVMREQHQRFESSQLEQYFSRQHSGLNPLANAAGELYLCELSDFMVCTLLPLDGSWLQLAQKEEPTQEKHKDIEAMLNRFRSELAESNFYGKMQELITQGLIHNTGLITVDWTQGLNFAVYTQTNTHVTNERDEYSNRSYAVCSISLGELFNTYTAESIPEKYQQLKENMDETGLGQDVHILTALVPNKMPYVQKNSSRYKFLQLTFILDSDLHELEPKHGKAVGFNHFPFCRFRTDSQYSLASKALPDAMMVNKYEQMFYDKGELATYPPLAISAETVARGAYDIGPGGMVPLNNHERKIEPIQTTVDLKVTEATIAKKEQRLREIFKIDLIQRVKVTNVSQAEYHQNYYNVLKSIQPLATVLVYRTINTMSKRIHKLLMDNDKKYRELAAKVDALVLQGLDFDHIGRLMKKADTMSKIGRFGQAAQFYAQLDPDAAVVVDAEKVLQEAANTLGIPEILKSKQEAQAEMQARAQAAGQQQAAEQTSLLNQGGANVGGQAAAGAAAGGPTGPGA